jgi:hypothetical protein
MLKDSSKFVGVCCGTCKVQFGTLKCYVGLGIELAFIFLNYELSLQYSVSFTVKEWKCASLWCYTKRITAFCIPDKQ